MIQYNCKNFEIEPLSNLQCTSYNITMNSQPELFLFAENVVTGRHVTAFQNSCRTVTLACAMNHIEGGVTAAEGLSGLRRQLKLRRRRVESADGILRPCPPLCYT